MSDRTKDILVGLLAAEIGAMMLLPFDIFPSEKNEGGTTALASLARRSEYMREIDRLEVKEDKAKKLATLDAGSIEEKWSPALQQEFKKSVEQASKQAGEIPSEVERLGARIMTDATLSEDHVGDAVKYLAEHIKMPLPEYMAEKDDRISFSPRALQQCNYTHTNQDAAALRELSDCTVSASQSNALIKIFSGTAGMMGASWAVLAVMRRRRENENMAQPRVRSNGHVPPFPLPPAPAPAPSPVTAVPTTDQRKINKLNF